MSRRSGHTLVEVMLVGAFLLLLATMSYRMMVSAFNFYRDADDSIEIQRSALLALTRMTADISGTDYDVVDIKADTSGITPVNADPATHYVASPPEHIAAPHYDIVVFSHPADVNGDFVVDPTTGRVHWQSAIGYFVEALPNGNHALIRSVFDFGGGIPAPPYPIPGLVADPYVMRGPGLDRGILARNIYQFGITKEVDTYDIILTVGLSSRNESSLSLRTKVFPRN